MMRDQYIHWGLVLKDRHDPTRWVVLPMLAIAYAKL